MWAPVVSPAPHPHGPSRDPVLGCRVAFLSEHTVSAKFGELQPYPLELTVAVSKRKHVCLSLFCLWTNILCDPALTICSVSPGVDLIAAFYGCLYCGCVPVTVRPPHPQNLGTTLPTVKMIVEVSSLFWQAMSSWVGSWHLSCMVFILCRMKLTWVLASMWCRSANLRVSLVHRPLHGCSSPKKQLPL